MAADTHAGILFVNYECMLQFRYEYIAQIIWTNIRMTDDVISLTLKLNTYTIEIKIKHYGVCFINDSFLGVEGV